MSWWERAEEDIPEDGGLGRHYPGAWIAAGVGGLVFFGGLFWTAHGWLAG